VRFVCFRTKDSHPRAGIWTERGVVPLDKQATSPQAEMNVLIDWFAELRPVLERRATHAQALPLDEVQLLAPLPRPGKILCSTATCDNAQDTERKPLLMTLKSAESVIGPGQTVTLPRVGDEWRFVAEAELGLVIRGPAKAVNARNWQSPIFGYTCVIDVMAQGDAQSGRDFWLAKADTLGPLGPCIITADELGDPARLHVKSTVNGESGQAFTVSDLDYSLMEQVTLATTVMTLYTGDVIACGTSRQGLRPLIDGDAVEVEIEGIGRLGVHIARAALRAIAGAPPEGVSPRGQRGTIKPL
jgi:2-keto-4-pentenoate hydratase/2-oxohepta-3-ene-1,7-dioic acid hydratase in catechol pathway